MVNDSMSVEIAFPEARHAPLLLAITTDISKCPIT